VPNGAGHHRRCDTGQMTRVGYVGLGNLGFHLAGSLVRAGYDLVVSDLNRDAAVSLLASGARWADSAHDVAA